MHNQLILFNPYYQKDVIEQHLKILQQKGSVAFGKVKSALKTVEHSFDDQLNIIYESIDADNYMQLFLTDYSSIYVAKVEKVTAFDKSELAPSYYKDKDFDVEKWFIITDMREIIKNDFENVRDAILANFTTPNFNNRTYALYGNNYVYPLVVDLKEEIDYFAKDDEEFYYYHNMFKTKEYLQIKENFIKYTFGQKWINKMNLATIDNLISAELEYTLNSDDSMYDFSTVVIKYSKIIEMEIYAFIKTLFASLIEKNKTLANIKYKIQNKDYILSDIFNHKPNLGTYKFLLRNTDIENAIQNNIEDFMTKKFIKNSLPYYIKTIQSIRNESVHASSATLLEATDLRKDILGLSKQSMIVEIIKYKAKVR
jgi:hypothetical protein